MKLWNEIAIAGIAFTALEWIADVAWHEARRKATPRASDSARSSDVAAGQLTGRQIDVKVTHITSEIPWFVCSQGLSTQRVNVACLQTTIAGTGFIDSMNGERQCL